MDTATPARALCRFCSRELSAHARVDYCHTCYLAHRCQACHRPWTQGERMGWCDDCKGQWKLGQRIRRLFGIVRPDPDEIEARLLVFAAKARREEPLF